MRLTKVEFEKIKRLNPGFCGYSAEEAANIRRLHDAQASVAEMEKRISVHGDSQREYWLEAKRELASAWAEAKDLELTTIKPGIEPGRRVRWKK